MSSAVPFCTQNTTLYLRVPTETEPEFIIHQDVIQEAQ